MTRALLLRAAATTMLAGSAWPGPLAGQREPVLSQVRVPHSYYYREMYLPQLTTGPASVAWSPDGTELVYSMGGTLWRQDADSAVAIQLTDGPGYDYQPDWSPDGRYVAYASYRNGAIELRMLDLEGGADRALVADGAVNVEPRWSPDGTRIAFVSTAHEGRWHVYLLPVNDGRPGAPERITEDRDSGLPRYYYSRWDHYLSPTWSPDGREILLVSNRDRIWGTGGIWRMEARAGAPMRLVHYEETTWKARPDWARDGRRVVYSSYHGRQWNQLWLQTPEGGDGLQLTYGEFDATAPRWSPDGRKVAFIANELGNTELRLLEIPGGRQRTVTAARRLYRTPVGTLRISVLDSATGRPVAARASVRLADGRYTAPADAWIHADDAYDRRRHRFEYAYFHLDGSAELAVPAGAVTLEIQRGPEYRVERRTARVPADSTATMEVRLARHTDLAGAGWVSGDLHVHMNYGGTYRNTPARLRFQSEAEDLHLVENLIVNKEQRIPDVAYFRPGPDPASSFTTAIYHGQEFHTSLWGHIGLLGLTSHLLLPDYSAYVNTAVASPYPANLQVVDLARAQGGVAGYVHPFDWDPRPADPTDQVTNELPVDVALGRVDYLEVVGFSDHLATARVWYRLLNLGFRIPAGGGTDAMANFASLRGPVGMNRVYVRTGGARDHEAFLAGLQDGRTFVTNGPLLRFTLEGREAGEEIRLDGRATVRGTVSLRSNAAVDHLEVIGNGMVVATIPVGGRTAVDTSVVLQVGGSGWYTLRAWSDSAREPVLDIYPFATTSPIYVTVAGAPLRSREDAAFFLAWIDRLIQAAAAHQGWNTAAERDEVLRRFEEAARVIRGRG